MLHHPNPDDVLAQARSVQASADHYVALAAEIRAELACQVPITEADFLPRGPDPYADEAPVF
jgi:hypothetical protein